MYIYIVKLLSFRKGKIFYNYKMHMAINIKVQFKINFMIHYSNLGIKILLESGAKVILL